MMSWPIEDMNPMSALRLGTNLMRQRLTWRDKESARPKPEDAIASDEDSIPMETEPMGEKRAIYEFPKRKAERPDDARAVTDDAASLASCLHIVSGLSTIVAAISRVREDKLPIEPSSELGHAANLLYMMTGEKPTPEAERVMDVALILHADHGMNASTFASMVVASTLSDIYLSTGAGIAALNGPLHGGANEEVLNCLMEINGPENVEDWFNRAMRRKRRIPGFGHRVYKVYDPRARVLAPLARHLVKSHPEVRCLHRTAQKLERRVVSTLGREKGVFPNVDFYSGLVYNCMGVPVPMFTPVFAASRAAGWVARIHEYLKHNRIFRPRAWYVGEFGKKYVPLSRRK
jgi:citrate synthase